MSLKKRVKKLYTDATSFLFDSLPDAVGTPLASLLIVAPVFLIAFAFWMGSQSHPSDVTVMVTNFAGNRGGSGVVIYTSKSASVILTNKHVCEVAKKQGGKVRLVSGKEHIIVDMLGDRYHDLCLVRVAADLKSSVKLAKSAPDLYSTATITGHPALMPNVITNGHFGGKKIISVVVGSRPCTEDDTKNKQNAFFCIFFGAIPVIRQFESQIVTATIMAGSSGSAVLNEKRQLSGLVFAGNARGLSYAYIVPFESVDMFVSSGLWKILNIGGETPWRESSKSSASFSRHSRYDIRNRCGHGDLSRVNARVKNFCEKVYSHIDL